MSIRLDETSPAQCKSLRLITTLAQRKSPRNITTDTVLTLPKSPRNLTTQLNPNKNDLDTESEDDHEERTSIKISSLAGSIKNLFILTLTLKWSIEKKVLRESGKSHQMHGKLLKEY